MGLTYNITRLAHGNGFEVSTFDRDHFLGRRALRAESLRAAVADLTGRHAVRYPGRAMAITVRQQAARKPARSHAWHVVIAARPAAASTDGVAVWLAREDGSEVELTDCRWYVETEDPRVGICGPIASLDAFAESDEIVLTRAEESAISRAYAVHMDEMRFEAVMP